MFDFKWITYLLAFALIIFIIIYPIYVLVIKNWHYFLDRNVEFERGLPILGSMYRYVLGKEPIAISTQDIYNKYSNCKFVGFYHLGGSPSYMIRDLDLIRDITIKNFDHFMNHHLHVNKNLDPVLGSSLFNMKSQEWKDMRGTLSPLFTASKMRFMLTLMMECVDEFTAHIRKEITSKSTTQSLEYNMMDLMMSLTNDIIGSTAFGIKINTLKQPENDFYKMSKEVAHTIFEMRTFVLITFRKVAAWLKLRIIPIRHVKFFRNVIHTTLEERERQNIVRNDMLHLLLLAKGGKLNVENPKDRETAEDTEFAAVRTYIAAKTSEKLKSKNCFLFSQIHSVFYA